MIVEKDLLPSTLSSGTNITTFHFLTENNQLGQDDVGEHEQTFYRYPLGFIDGH